MFCGGESFIYIHGERWKTQRDIEVKGVVVCAPKNLRLRACRAERRVGGGYGCWNYAIAFPEKLTTIVPISGGGNKNKACNLKPISIWAFHNETDGPVDVSNSINMINAVNACPPLKEVKLTIFPDEGHDCWRRVYDQNSPDWLKPGKSGIAKVDIYSWMLSKSK